MSYSDKLAGLRALARGEQADDAFRRWLIARGAYGMLAGHGAPPLEVALTALVVNRRYHACREVFAALEELSYAHIKGAALSERLYGNPVYRTSGDIDLLVAPEDAERVKQILTAHGFIQGRVVKQEILPFSRRELIYQKTFSHQVAPFVKATGDAVCPFVNLDVNLDIVWGQGAHTLDMRDVIGQSESFVLQGIRMRRLRPVWEFLALCMHHYKDMNSVYLLAEQGLSMSAFCDIYHYLVHVAPDLDELCEAARRYGIGDYVYYTIHYAHMLFADERLLPYLERLVSPSAEALLPCYGLNEAERREWRVPFFERLFDEELPARFYASLDEGERRQVALNREFMQ